MIRKKMYNIIKENLNIEMTEENKEGFTVKILKFELLPKYMFFKPILTATFEIIAVNHGFYDTTYKLEDVEVSECVKKKYRKYIELIIKDYFDKFVELNSNKEVEEKENILNELVEKALRGE